VESGDLKETADGIQILGLGLALLSYVPRHIGAWQAANRVLKKIDALRETTKLFFVVSSSLLMLMFVKCDGFLDL
jgi:hypothetical protein